MKKITRSIAALAITLICAAVTAQDSGPPGAVKWQWTLQPAANAGQGVYELRFSGRIAPGYIVYASDFSLDIGPRPTRLKLEDAANVTARGTLSSTGAHEKKDPAFAGAYRYFDGTALLSQQLTVKDATARVKGALVGQICHEADGTCSLFNQKFEVPVP
jgi:hypothetical protein